MNVQGTVLWRAAVAAGVVAAGFYSLTASNGSIQTQNWWTGLSHATVWGPFAVVIVGATSPPTACTANTPPRVEPPDWWAAQPTGITSSSDAVGTTIWSSTDTACPRAMETLYRSVLVADLSGYYARFPAGTAQTGNRITKATLDFNVVAMTPTNPLNWTCNSFTGGMGVVNVLRRNPVVVQGTSTAVVDTTIRAGLVRATPNGPIDGPAVLTAFPTVGDMVADLGGVGATGSFNGGKLVVVDTGPGIHNVKIDVTRWVTGAANVNLPFIAFSVAGANEATINPPSPIQFDCRGWVQPIQLTVDFTT